MTTSLTTAASSSRSEFGRRFANRELSWLAFNHRVLGQASNPRFPLLERVKFLSIVSSNLDEFFEIRVAGLMQHANAGSTELSLDGLRADEQLRAIDTEVRRLVQAQYSCWQDELVPALAAEGITFVSPAQFTTEDSAWIARYFEDQVLPVLTPLALDQAHPFPWIGNKTLNVLALLGDATAPSTPPIAAIVPVPRVLPRVLLLPGSSRTRSRQVFLTDIIRLHAGALFPGYQLSDTFAFRLTRNSDLYIDEEEAENLLKKIEHELRNRHRGAAVRLEVNQGVPPSVLRKLCTDLNLDPSHVFELPRPLNLLRLMTVYDLVDRPELKFSPHLPAETPALRPPACLFRAIQERDILLHHPYDAYAPVVDFVTQASRDPEVLGIKQTLYRTSGDSPFISALIQAALAGKQVTALVELRARFDEANNIKWARELEEAGVHVVYGVVGLKTHCKCCLVVRREGTKLRRYAHFGTGNYNPKTARLYTDVSLLTCRSDLTAEAAALFNTLTGLGRAPVFHRLLVAPFNLHARVQELIQAETAHAAAGRPARIVVKVNKLVDPVTIDHLYAASSAGVRVDLIVRATCCVQPGVPGLSENIRLRSLVGRFLEHARVLYFENNGDPIIYCGSADWMPRNFFRRFEVMFPVDDPEFRRQLIDDLLEVELLDDENACEIGPDSRTLSKPGSTRKQFCAQTHFSQSAVTRAQREQQRRTAVTSVTP